MEFLIKLKVCYYILFKSKGQRICQYIENVVYENVIYPNPFYMTDEALLVLMKQKEEEWNRLGE